jgi:hypothetical protein
MILGSLAFPSFGCLDASFNGQFRARPPLPFLSSFTIFLPLTGLCIHPRLPRRLRCVSASESPRLLISLINRPHRIMVVSRAHSMQETVESEHVQKLWYCGQIRAALTCAGADYGSAGVSGMV